MRYDDKGFFWEDEPVAGRGGSYIRPMPEIPRTGWKAPSGYPDLSAAPYISFDTETYDPELLDHGPGWARGRGHVVGVSVAVDGWCGYYPLGHETSPEENVPRDNTLRWLRDTLGNPRQMKVGANLLYDVGWLRHEGVDVKGELYDVQFAEALLREGGSVALESLGTKYLGEGKQSNQLYQWLADWFGGEPDHRQRRWLYRAPASLVGPYAESDAYLPAEVAKRQWPLLQREGLADLLKMECALIPLLVNMRFAGVRVDVGKAEEVRQRLEDRENELVGRLRALCGFDVNVNASSSLAEAWDTLGLPYGRTPKGQPQFTKESLSNTDHEAARLVVAVRQTNKTRKTFVESYVLDGHVNGVLHGQFHPLRGSSGGTRSGRFSSSTPNLQNLPSRDPVLGPLVRSLFVPHEGHRRWLRWDYSQIEYRFLAHYATGPGANELRQRYASDPDTDYHRLTQELVAGYTGRTIDRKPIKNINFGLIYGMGAGKLSASLGMAESEGRKLFDAYHQAAPFAKATMEQCAEEARTTGKVSTVLGRLSRFDLWEPDEFGHGLPALPFEAAIKRYGRVRRAYTHKALNRRLQGSAADLMKVAMLECHRAGVFDVTGAPLLTVHDELDFSDPGGCDEAFAEVERIMENCLELRVPVRVDGESGPSWGECH